MNMGKAFLLTIDLEEFDRATGDQRFTISKEGLELASREYQLKVASSVVQSSPPRRPTTPHPEEARRSR